MLGYLREGLSEPEFYCDLFYKFKKLKVRNVFFLFSSEKIITRYRHIGYNECYLNQSWLITTLPSLIANRWVGHQTL